MDPIYERRNMSRNVHLDAKFLQANIGQPLKRQLKMNVEGRCVKEGFVSRDSCTVINYSLGRLNYIKGGSDYEVQFQADVCMPHAGQRFEGIVNNRSRVGVHIDIEPMKILIPRDIHIGNVDFEECKIGDTLQFEVIGSQFSQLDTEIIVVAKLTSRVQQEKPTIIEEVVEQPQVAGNDSEKKVVINTSDLSGKRKLKRKSAKETNEPE